MGNSPESRQLHHYDVQGRSPTSGERPFSLVNQWVTVCRRPERFPGSQAEAGEQTGEQNPKRVDWRRLFPRFRGEILAKPLEVFPHVDRRTVPQRRLFPHIEAGAFVGLGRPVSGGCSRGIEALVLEVSA